MKFKHPTKPRLDPSMHLHWLDIYLSDHENGFNK